MKTFLGQQNDFHFNILKHKYLYSINYSSLQFKSGYNSRFIFLAIRLLNLTQYKIILLIFLMVSELYKVYIEKTYQAIG